MQVAIGEGSVDAVKHVEAFLTDVTHLHLLWPVHLLLLIDVLVVTRVFVKLVAQAGLQLLKLE